MSMTKYMHKRNIFKNKKIDFKYFCEKYEFFKQAVFKETEIEIDFKNPACLAAISKALLLEHFKLDIKIPIDRLIPTIPLRLNYILWLEDFANALQKPMNSIKVLDIGCGPNCIYGVLGAAKNGWRFVCTDTDDYVLEIATENVQRNQLESQIKILKVGDTDSMLDGAFELGDRFDFVMCNPPFFGSISEKCGATVTRNMDRRDPAKSVNVGDRSDAITEGGEIDFTKKLFEESRKYADRAAVFTVMLGRKSSSTVLLKWLQAQTEPCRGGHSVYELCQGRVTRWGLAWSFVTTSLQHPRSEFARAQTLKTAPVCWDVPANSAVLVGRYREDAIMDFVRQLLTHLDIKSIEQKNRQSVGGGSRLVATALRNTWSHQRRRRRQLKLQQDKELDPPCAKRQKLEDICSEALNVYCSSPPVANDDSCDLLPEPLKFSLETKIVPSSDSNQLPVLQLQLNSKEGDRDSLNQVLTFIKNQMK